MEMTIADLIALMTLGGGAVFGLVALLEWLAKRRKPKTTAQRVEQAIERMNERRAGQTDEVVVEIVYQRDEYLSLSVRGAWFTQMTHRQYPARQAILISELSKLGFIVYTVSPIISELFDSGEGESACVIALDNRARHLDSVRKTRYVFKIKDDGHNLEEVT